MRIYFPLQFISQARAHQVFDAVRRFEPHQLKEPCIDRYVYKQVRNRHFVAIGVETQIDDVAVFVWLEIMHRKDRRWREFRGDPGRYRARVLEPLLSREQPYIEAWLWRGTAAPEAPPMPESYKPWLEPLHFQTSGVEDYPQIYETPGWIEAIGRRSVWEYWQSWYRVLLLLAQSPGVGEPAPGFRALCIHSDGNAHVIFARRQIGNRPALLLLRPIVSQVPVDRESLESLPNSEELRDIDRRLDTEEELTPDTLARIARRTWPALLLADESLWKQLSQEDGSNLSLSAEEEQILEHLTGSCSRGAEARLPCFLDGRAGSGKSTLLAYVFARYCARKLIDGWEGIPLYLTLNERLLERARDTVVSLLNNNATFMLELGATAADVETQVKDWFKPLDTLLLELLAGPGVSDLALPERFADDKRVSFHRFHRLYLGEGLFPEEQRLSLKRRPRVSPESAWFAIRALIKGTSEDNWLDPDGFRRLEKKTRAAISQALFENIYEHVWERWYRKLCEQEGLWDDQDLARAVLNEVPELPEHTLICCDEAQDLTRIEATLLFRFSILNRYPFPPASRPILPFLFAGDPLQTINPSGFRWAALQQLFQDEIRVLVDPESKLAISVKPLSLNLNYRSGKHIVDLLNLVQAWRHVLFEWDSEHEPQEGWCPLESMRPTCFVLGDDNGGVSAAQMSELLQDTLLLADAGEGGEASWVDNDPVLSLLYKGSKGDRRNLLTPITAKGLEASKVVVYRFGDRCDIDLWHKESDETARHSQEHFWNKLYVALSRATRYLFIVDTKEGYERLWKKLEGTDPAIPPDRDLGPTWLDAVSRAEGLVRGGEKELSLLREQDPQGVASNLESTGTNEGNPILLRKARGYYRSLGMTRKADECEAVASELELRFLDAGRLRQKLGSYKHAADLFWRVLAWNDLRKLYDEAPECQTPERALLVSCLEPLATKAGADGSKRGRVLESSLPQLAHWLEQGNTPPVLSSQWSALEAELKKGTGKAAWGALSPSGRSLLARVAERLQELGRSTGELAAKCWHKQKEWSNAVRCWERMGLTTRIEYKLAKAELTTPPERLRWLHEAREYKRVVDEWRTRQTFDEDWMEYVVPALGKEKAWGELIRCLLRRKRAGEEAADVLLEHYKDLEDDQRSRLRNEVFEALLKRLLLRKAVTLASKLPELEKAREPTRGAASGPPGTERDTGQSESIRLHLEGRLAKALLSPRVERAKIDADPSVRMWREGFRTRLAEAPGLFVPTLSPQEMVKLLEWRPATGGDTAPVLERWAKSDNADIRVAANAALRRQKAQNIEGEQRSGERTGSGVPSPLRGRPAIEGVDRPPEGAEVIHKQTGRGPRGAKAGARAATPTSGVPVMGKEESGLETGESGSGAMTTPLDLTHLEFVAIEQLRLRNFRAYDNACLRLGDFTVLIGRNGAGKSTLREALEILKESLTDSLANALSRRGGLEQWVRQSGKERETSLVLSAQLRFKAGGRVLRAVYGFELLLEEEGEQRVYQEHLVTSLPENLVFRREGGTFTTSLPISTPQPALDQLALPILAGSHPVWNACLDALKGIRTYDFSVSSMRELAPALNAESLKWDGRNAANVLKRLESRNPSMFAAIQRRMQVVVPGLERVLAHTFGGKRLLRFEQRGERLLRLEPTQVSDGTLRCLGILLALYQQPAPALVLIEELEDSIHPEAFGTLLEAIEEVSERTQVAVTTHSPTALMLEPVTEARTRLVQWELGRSEIYGLESPPPKPDDYPYSVGELLQFNALPIASSPSSVKGSFFEVEADE